ncbi:MAG: helix-turn-helix domain-containing protein [Candidatus Eisenbacteria bacterium]|nr:helix-turn-helix domain-containing protein [Candidatus Eisenbacteria bacterium]
MKKLDSPPRKPLRQPPRDALAARADTPVAARDEFLHPSGFSQVDLGQRLRDARRGAQLTLQQLSRLSGYSVTHLSQVERGHACPTIGALRRISSAIGRDIRTFLEASPLPEVSMVRKGERQRLQLESSHEQVEIATRRVPGGEIQAAVHVVRPFAGKEPPQPSVAENARYFYVLRGRLELQLEDRPVTCEAGDAVHVSGGSQLTFRNTEREACELLVIALGAAL